MDQDKQRTYLSRRAFLRRAGLIGGAALASAYGDWRSRVFTVPPSLQVRGAFGDVVDLAGDAEVVAEDLIIAEDDEMGLLGDAEFESIFGVVG